jgi:hypothetical protein
MARRKWTKDRVKQRLRELESEGMLRPGYLTVKHGGLFSAGTKLFGSSWEMYKAAGIDPVRLGVRRRSGWKWTSDNIISELTRLRLVGEDIRPRALHEKHSGLLDSGERIIGSSRKMYKAAGIEPTELGMPIQWNQEKVVQCIKDRYQAGKDMDQTTARREFKELAVAAKAYFGGWYSALKAAGIEPDKYRLKKPDGYWTKEMVGKAILQRLDSGQHMSLPEVRGSDPRLLSAANAAFGHWYGALKAVGIDESKFRVITPMGYWSSDRVLKEIREIYNSGVRPTYLNAKSNYPLLFNAAVREYGSWYPAIEAAGIESRKFRRFRPVGYWSKDKVKDEIRRLRLVNEDMSLVSIRETNGAMYNGARHAFGSWKKALEETGYDYKAIRKDMMQESFEGIVFEVYVKEALRVLGWDVQYHKHFPFGEETCVPDFFDASTGVWIDAKLNCSGHGVRSRIEKYLQYTDKVKIIYLKGRRMKWGDASVDFLPIGRLYPKLVERGAKELVENIELLRHGITRPDLQSRIVDFVSSVSPGSVTMVKTQLEKIRRL